MVMGTAMAMVMVLVMATTMAMALVMRGDGKGNGYGDGNGYGNGNGNGEALFVGSGRVVICEVLVRSRCMQHRCNARLCGKVPKMLLSVMSLASLFSCVLVRTATFVNGDEEGDGDGNKGGG
jgi:hypothetical protein